MQPKTILIANIDDTNRLRPVDMAHAELIAASIEQKGLIQPIVVRPMFPLADDQKNFTLVVGAHRLAGMRILGWQELIVGETVIIRESDEFSAKIDEIDENIARHDLNVLDRAIFMAERKRLYEERNATLGHGGNRKDVKFKEKIKRQSLPLDFSPRFTADAANRTGFSERSVRLAVQLAKALDPEAIAAIRGTMLENNQIELLALSKLPPEQQRAVAGFIKAGTARNVLHGKWAAKIEKEPRNDPQARVLTALLECFEKASKRTREQFMESTGLAYRKDEDAK